MEDYHVHSGFLDHTKDSLEGIVETAGKLGFEKIAITEHFIWDAIMHPKKGEDTLFVEPSKIPNDGRQTTDLQTYVAEIERVAQKFKVRVLKGLEVDYFPRYEEQIRQTVQRFRFDILLGSCHYIYDRNRPHGQQYIHLGINKSIKDFIGQHSIEALYRVYFENIELAVLSGLFDYMAHIDFLRKAIPEYSERTASQYLYPILRLMIERGVGLEINLSGIRRFGVPFPFPEVIDEYKRLGGKKISIGSDAHSVKRLIETQPLIKEYEKRYA